MVAESRVRAVPRDLRVQAARRLRENGFMSDGGEVAHRQTHGALHPRVNLGRADQALASQARAVDHQETMTTVHGVLMMEVGLIVHTMDVSCLFVVMCILTLPLIW